MKRIVLLTGSMGRLGSALCEKYYDDYVFVGCGRTKKSNFAHYFIQADINTQAEEIVEETLQKFKRVDVLINNAAIYCIQPLKDISVQMMRDVFETNVIAPHNLSNLVLKKFWSSRLEKNKERNRNIINISSVSDSKVYEGQGAYGPSKAALSLLTLYQAKEFSQYNIRVNALSPTSFPHYITTEAVADMVVEMDRSNLTGLIKVIL